MAIYDCTRVSYAGVLPDEYAATAAGFLEPPYAWYAAHGVTVRRLLTDYGGNYRSADFATVRRSHSNRHYRTPPLSAADQREGRALHPHPLHEWAYAQAYGRSQHRTRDLLRYLRFYNAERRHTALGFLTPLHRLAAKQCITSASSTSRDLTFRLATLTTLSTISVAPSASIR